MKNLVADLAKIFKKKYYHKEMQCPHCKQFNKPIVKRNRICNIMMPSGIGSDEARTRRNYFLICPNCKYIITSIK
jgi:phage FluMu protein Com